MRAGSVGVYVPPLTRRWQLSPTTDVYGDVGRPVGRGGRQVTGGSRHFQMMGRPVKLWSGSILLDVSGMMLD